MHIDFTAIWGLMPEQAPHAVRTIGNVDAVEQKIVLPQIASILRNNGSKYQAVQLLVGDDREKYQTASLDEFREVMDAKKISLLYGLVRHVYIPEEVRKPIQMSFIADELTFTRAQEQETAREEGSLREAEEQVMLASKTVEVQTKKLVAAKEAEGDREAETTRAETIKLVAAIDKETAVLEAEAEKVRGEAENKGKQMIEEATADRFRLAVEAFGTPRAYNNWIFASGLPDDVNLQLIYAGQGTLWTDVDKAGAGFGIRATLPLNQEKTHTGRCNRRRSLNSTLLLNMLAIVRSETNRTIASRYAGRVQHSYSQPPANASAGLASLPHGPASPCTSIWVASSTCASQTRGLRWLQERFGSSDLTAACAAKRPQTQPCRGDPHPGPKGVRTPRQAQPRIP